MEELIEFIKKSKRYTQEEEELILEAIYNFLKTKK